MAEKVEEKLTVAAVARRIGVAPATLRTWDRRYGLGPSQHVEGEHRRYCPKDLAILTAMRKLITSGVSPAEAAQQAKAFKGKISVEQIVDNFEVRELSMKVRKHESSRTFKNRELSINCEQLSNLLHRTQGVFTQF